ncbi:MAG: 2-dehydropantoate 2-reductase [Rhodospirillaceae bacterium]|nr:2-dehydropantoate 2-reductase [Rhodospirillaceae bacterium]
MRIAVIGAGGVGGYFGGRLAAAGEDVVLVQRGAHGAAMRKDGLKVLSPLGDFTVPGITCVETTEGLDPADVIIVTVKSGGTDEAAQLAKPLVGPDTAVISLQNGVENEDRLAAVVGAEHVLGGVAYILSLIEAPGVIRHGGKMQKIVFGERDGSRSARGEAFLAACRNAGIEAELSESIDSALWSKFAILCPHTGMTAATRMPIGPIRDDADCRAMLLAAVEEIIALAEARGIGLPQSLHEAPLAFTDGLPPDTTSSMHYDITHGRLLELEWLSGTVVRLGRASGVPTPVNDFLYAVLKLHIDGTPADKSA